MSKSLCERIVDHMLERGWLHEGETVGDCFGGVGTTGIICAYRGLRCVSVELEPRFVSMARRNYALHQSKWKRLGAPRPVIVQGDSRHFDEIVGRIAGAVCSPPYAAIAAGAGGLNTKPPKHAGQQSGRAADSASQTADQRYGKTEGQIAWLSEGSVEAVVTSPPFAQTLAVNNTVCGENPGKGEWRCGNDSAGRMKRDYIEPCSPGQIGQLRGGSLDGAITSPPYRDQNDHERPMDSTRNKNGRHAINLPYGETAGQIGREKAESYWEAVSLVYAAVYRSLKPGGVSVPDGEGIDFCDCG